MPLTYNEESTPTAPYLAYNMSHCGPIASSEIYSIMHTHAHRPYYVFVGFLSLIENI